MYPRVVSPLWIAAAVCIAAALLPTGCGSKGGLARGANAANSETNSTADNTSPDRSDPSDTSDKSAASNQPDSPPPAGAFPSPVSGDPLNAVDPGEPAASGASTEAVADYLVGPGDLLEIIYQVRNVGQAAAYRLSIQDEISVKFQFTPEYDRRTFVQTDGKVRLPVIGDVTVAGKTTAEVEEELKTLYSNYLKEPVIQVVLEKSNYAIEELKRAITTAPRGQSRLEPVRPDGFISLPLIGDVQVGGRTVPEASASIVERYREQGVVDIDVTVVLLEVKSTSVYVLGEVASPGAVVVYGKQDVWRVVGQAGGFGQDADRAHVIVVKSTPRGESRFVVNFDAWQTGRDPLQTVIIDRGDVIYVPKLSSRYIYVLGEVEKPGQFSLDPQSSLTVSQAVALGGQIKAGANRTQVLVLRRTLDNQPVVLEVDLKELFNPSNYDDPDDERPKDYALEPGDIVYVPASRVGRIDRFAEAYFRDGIWTIIPFTVTLPLR